MRTHLTCPRCSESKAVSEFYKMDGRSRHGSTLCKECFKRYLQNRWIGRKLQAVEYKGGKCNRCGYAKCLGALQFHHVDPTQKEFTWRTMRNKPLEEMKSELNKCELLCANCHAEEHYKGIQEYGETGGSRTHNP